MDVARHRKEGYRILTFNAGDKARLMPNLENKTNEKPKKNFPSINFKAWR